MRCHTKQSTDGNHTGAADAGTPFALFLWYPAIHSPVAAAARHTISFGVQTWPHRLVRVLIAEQVYRALSIEAGTPYHRE